MLKIFRKSKPIVDAVGVSAPPDNNYPVEVQQIHHAFNTAADRLVEEAKEIMTKAAACDIQKVSRLESLGFKQVKQVAEIKPLIKAADLSKEQLELLAYYKQNYPFNKFITEVMVQQICSNWGLVCGSVDLFKGFVPEKNLKQIEQFKLKPAEASIITFTNVRKYNGNNLIDNISITNGEVHCVRDYWHLYKKGSKLEHDNRAFQSSDGINFYASDMYNIFGLAHIGNIRFNISQGLQICAPIKDMDTTGMKISRGYKLVKHVPDPVVLQPVNGGYLILTAWGDEASDPLVVNEINN